MENRVGKADSFNGYADIASIVENKEDQEFLRNEMKQMIEHHGGDYKTLKKKVENIYKMDSWEKPLNDGAGMRLELKKEQAELLKEAGIKWVECYFKIVERRSKDTYDDFKSALMNTVRARLMAFYLLKDQSFKVAHEIGTPLETLTLMAFPPVIRY
jgi:coproporphyrinogen III oxidase